MAVESDGLNEAVMDAVAENITLRLHTGNPGTNGTSNLIATSTLDRPVITGGSGWSIVGAVATPTANPDFGVAGVAVNGVSWLSMFKGVDFWGRRELAAPMDVVLGAPVALTRTTLTVTASSVDA